MPAVLITYYPVYIFRSEKNCENYLTKLRIPAPWAAGKTVETIHPVRDNYKFRETVHIPGARCLYLRFEPRCASQYDYDKVNKKGGSRECFTKAKIGFKLDLWQAVNATNRGHKSTKFTFVDSSLLKIKNVDL